VNQDQIPKTTDPQDEMFDVVDQSGQVIGQATRRECHSNPDLCHRAVYVLIMDSRHHLFLQKRSPTKDTYPNRWTVSVSGHLNQGENYQTAALREIQEELGVTISDLEALATWRIKTDREQEVIAFFLARHNGPFEFEKSEISDGKFFSLADILAAQQEEDFQLTPVLEQIVNSWQEAGQWPPPLLLEEKRRDFDFSNE